MSLVSFKPRFTTDEAQRTALKTFGIEGAATELVGERDQNFRIDTTEGAAYLLRFANPEEGTASLGMRDLALSHIEREGLGASVPRLIRTTSNLTHGDTGGDVKALVQVRLFAWVEGEPLALVKPHPPELLEELGRLLGRIDRILQGVDWPDGIHDHPWDLEKSIEHARENVPLIQEDSRRSLISGILDRLEHDLAPRFSELRRGPIHGDANEYNVIVATGTSRNPALSGLIDFGDLGKSFIAGEPAIAAAYIMLEKTDPLAAAASVVRGFHGEYPLTESEADLVYDLALLRLCQSVATSARQRQDAPDNEYLTVSEAPAWDLLERLSFIHPNYGRAVIREAAGLSPCPEEAEVRTWIRNQSSGASKVLPDTFFEKPVILDLSVGSTSSNLSADEIRQTIAAKGGSLGVGRYDEARLCYDGAQYDSPGEDFPETRTIHLGVDLFAPAGTEVRAPLDSVVVSIHDNDAPKDYGPTVILRHDIPEGPSFFSLYGHLSRSSLESLEIDSSIAAGKTFATLGKAEENGGWPPHLHFQLIVNRLGFEGDFPGVAAPSQREVWLGLSPDPTELLGLPGESAAPRPRDHAEMLEDRHAHLGPSLSIHYRRPLHIVRGRGAYLYDECGQAYLDTVNNVCHVGHSHPRVVRAASEQMAVLNTNTRYLHENLLRYSERLTGLLPDPLSVCFLVCSGSEANELALRMARNHTNSKNVIVMDGAYHGNTQGLVDISPYKHNGPGGRGAPPHVHAVPLPDPWRGQHREGAGDLGALYAEYVANIIRGLEDDEGSPPTFICESLPSCGGQIELPDGYLKKTYKAVREVGGVCIADEVQVGFGRTGEKFWGFETQGVVPDIVTLGKPIGNGHPLAAVVTTPEIAKSFANGMEYFNTFGGNPVSCAVGLAVLDVIEEEGLQESALAVGGRTKERLLDLRKRHALIGDVRGLGLFLGIELNLDREARDPAPAHASHISNRMRDLGILMGTDGPDANVLKIKPPLCFSDEDSARLIAALDRVLQETALSTSG